MSSKISTDQMPITSADIWVDDSDLDETINWVPAAMVIAGLATMSIIVLSVGVWVII